MRQIITLSCAVGLIVLGGLTTGADGATAARWPGWRGDGTAISSERNLPVRWDAQTNVVWKCRLPGEGNSSPIVWDSHVFVTAATEKGKVRHIICIDATTGDIVWDTPLPPTVRTKTYPKTGHAAPTPVTDGRRVYAFFDSPGVVAVDMKGNPLWSKDLGPFDNLYNMAASPVLCDGLVIQVCDHNGASFVVALDAATGEQRWRTPRDVKANSASPTVISVRGGKQIVVPGPTVTAYDASDGKAVWWCAGMKPYVTPTAVYDGRYVYATSGRNGPAMAIDPTGRGDVAKTHMVMQVPTGGPYVPSPILYPLLVLPSDNGAIRMVDGSGEVVIDHRVKGKFTSSPVAGDGKLYWVSETGDTFVVDVTAALSDDPKVEVVAVNPLGEKALASPAIAGGRIYIRTNKHLYCIAGDRPAVAATKKVQLPDDFDKLAAMYNARLTKARTWAGEGDEDAMVRLEVIGHMAETIRTPEAAAFIGRAADKDPHWDVREEAAKLLGRYGADAEAPCIHLMTTTDSKGRQTRPYQRIIAAGHLGKMQSPAAVDALLANAGDKTAEIRVAVIAALGQIAQAHESTRARILPALLAALDDEDSVVKRAAADAVANLAGKLGRHQQAIVAKLRTLAAGDDRLVCERAETALKAIAKASR